jgi:hydroxypyruvate reductase
MTVADSSSGLDSVVGGAVGVGDFFSSLLQIFQAALQAADPTQAVLRHLRVEDTQADRIFVIGAGKAGASMAQAVEQLLGPRITAGLVNIKYGHNAHLKYIALNECGHPIPDASGVDGAKRIAQIAGDATDGDLVICLISGGASALLPLPVAGVTLEDKQRLTELLLACGANIHEINSVRKHLSRLKGGQLAKLAYPARILTLILSDVIGDNLDVIGSGPTVPDSSTFADARAVLDKYKLWEQVPGTIVNHLRSAAEETPKAGDPVFEHVQNRIVGSNRLAVNAAAEEARALGYHTLILSTSIQGETRDVARMHAAIARETATSGNPVEPPACIISGGETTVTLRGNGLGGRNQEFALAAAIDIAGSPNITILSAGTDGTDGPTDAAGAVVDGHTVEQAAKLGLSANDYLARNDSYRFFEAAGGLIKTGPTNTNVADVRVMLIKPY